MRTAKHNERLADRRSAYADEKQSTNLARRAAELLAIEPSLGTIGDARGEVMRRDTEKAKAEYAAERAARTRADDDDDEAADPLGPGAPGAGQDGSALAGLVIAALESAAERYQATRRLYKECRAAADAAGGSAKLPRETADAWATWSELLLVDSLNAASHMAQCLLTVHRRIGDARDIAKLPPDWEPVSAEIDGVVYTAGPTDECDDPTPLVFAARSFTCRDFLEVDYAIDVAGVLKVVEDDD